MYCDITTLTGYSNMERVYYSTIDDTEDRRLLDLSIKEIPSGYRLELDTCKAGYSYDTNEKPFIAVCQNGKYKYYNEGNNCVQKCNYKDLVSNIDQKALSWYQVNRSGEKIIDGKTIISSTGKDQYDSVDVETGTYFSINTCADGYSTPEDNAIIVQCRNGGWRVISNSTGICMEGCKNNDIFNNVIGLTSMIETNKSGNVLEPEHTITADGGITKAGLYFKPNSCGDGYGIYKDEAAIFRCYGGIWSVVKNNDYLCMPDCNNSDLFSTLHNIKSLIETDSAGNIVDNATILENGNGKTKAGKAFKIYECNDGFEVNKFKSIVLECYRGGWRITRNSSGLCITTNN